MKHLNRILPLAVALAIWLLAPGAGAQGTVFTYQGLLDHGANAANGSYDFRFALYDDATAGTTQGAMLTKLAVPVSNGLFTVEMDFGNQFPGAGRWLELYVRTNGTGSYRMLSPRQALTATPYAVTAANVSGIIDQASLPAGVVTNGANGLNLSGSFTGNGANVTNVNAASLGGITSTGFWKTNGNAGTAGAFLGTTDDQPLILKVNGSQALRLQYATNPTFGISPNIMGGYAGNIISNGVVGGFIGGGGSSNFPNRVGGLFASVLGGISNTASGNPAMAMGNSTTAMGANTTASGYYSTAMGYITTASGNYSTAMGINTIAHGDYSTAMGASTTASGIFSTAMGNHANAVNRGSFVWADASSLTLFSSTADNQFLVRASGGVGINNNSPQATLDVAGSFRINGGSTFNRVQDGFFDVGNNPGSITKVVTNTFPVAFTSAPTVTATAVNQPGSDFDDCFVITVRRVTTTQVVFNIVRVDAAAGWSQNLRIAYHAWE